MAALDEYAFPSPHFLHQNGDLEWGSSGMMLRDWFAGQMLAGDSANSEKGIWKDNASTDRLLNRAKLYYRMADAMMIARSEPPSNLSTKSD